nr:hypothetical protein Iba_chr03bCG0380 [Ipomoea batatas]
MDDHVGTINSNIGEQYVAPNAPAAPAKTGNLVKETEYLPLKSIPMTKTYQVISELPNPSCGEPHNLEMPSQQQELQCHQGAAFVLIVLIVLITICSGPPFHEDIPDLTPSFYHDLDNDPGKSSFPCKSNPSSITSELPSATVASVGCSPTPFFFTNWGHVPRLYSSSSSSTYSSYSSSLLRLPPLPLLIFRNPALLLQLSIGINPPRRLLSPLLLFPFSLLPLSSSLASFPPHLQRQLRLSPGSLS